MALNCPCPRPGVLTAVPNAECVPTFGQIVRFAIQLRPAGGAAAFKSTGTTPNPITALASWQAFETATGSTKIVTSPKFAGLTIPSSEPEYGDGGNAAFGGIAPYVGEGPVNITGAFDNLTKEQIQALRVLSCESITSMGNITITVYFFNIKGQIIAYEVAAGEHRGFDFFNFRLGSTGSEGLNSNNKHPFGFSLASDWDDKVVVINPNNWNPLYDLNV